MTGPHCHRSAATRPGCGSCRTRTNHRTAPIGGSAKERARTSAQTVANLRAAAGRYPDDPGLRRLLADLRRGSAEFRELWDAVDASVWRSHTKTVVHPSLGDLTLECDTLHIPESDQLLVVYSAAPGTSESEALSLLRVVGTQDLRPAQRFTPGRSSTRGH